MDLQGVLHAYTNHNCECWGCVVVSMSMLMRLCERVMLCVTTVTAVAATAPALVLAAVAVAVVM